MASEVKTNKVSPATGVALSIGDSGDTITVPSGATLDISASTLTPPATMPASSGVNFTALNATNLGSGTVPTARLGSGTADATTFLTGAQTYVVAGAGGISWQSVKTATFTAVAGEGYPCNTTAGGFTVDLPSSPSVGDTVVVVDYAGTFDTNAITIDANASDKINGSALNVVVNKERCGVDITYVDATQGWIATSGVNDGTEAMAPSSYDIDFLVIAGGGGGGTMGAGAGGYRASYSSEASGGGGSSESAYAATIGGAVLTITVGGGGQGWIWPSATHAADGTDSVFAAITSVSGGKGGENGPGGAGGCGGGGGTPIAYGTSNQGYAGGTATSNGYGSGGGGGASAVGGNYTGTVGGAGTAGVGGNGVASTITAGSVTRAGGGAGGAHALFGQGSATGGSGGGGNGGTGGGAGGTGTVNSGSGGGGGALNAAGNAIGAGALGGSGVVILRMLTTDYTTTTTGSPGVTTDGGDTILTYQSSGTYTP